MYTMRPAEFAYHRPGSLDEALSLLGEGEETRPLAGDHSLLPLMKLRLSMPAALVDLAGVPGLDEIAEDREGLRIGALAMHASVAGSELVRSRCPVLAETAALIGDVQVRNRGTLGGSVAHADPAADYPTILKALGAKIVVAGSGGEREVAADDFFVDVFTTALQPGELVVAAKVPATPAGTGAAYLKHRHPASFYAVVGVAAVVSVEGGTCSSARLTIGGVAGTPVHGEAAAESLIGAPPSEESATAAAEKVPEALPNPMSDTYASGEYRVHLATLLAKRALLSAFERAA
jgi:aerobic carbon-monoxide dehydrogenase medium subunit